jgi:hypothetical protein
VKLSWYDHDADNPPWIKALADVRRMGTLEGYCYVHVQALKLRSLGEEGTFALIQPIYQLMAGAVKEQGGSVKDFAGDGINPMNLENRLGDV